MKIQIRFKATATGKEANHVYSCSSFLKFLQLYFKAKREKASAFFVFFD